MWRMASNSGRAPGFRDNVALVVGDQLMNHSDIQETIVSLYLRLNGYFVSGFIAHAPIGARTEMDVLAVRFPRHNEPEREVPPCGNLLVPPQGADFIIGEVKGGKKLKFNAGFWNSPDAIESVLRRIGAFDDGEIERLRDLIPAYLHPDHLNQAASFPGLDVNMSDELGGARGTLRFVLFTPEQTRLQRHSGPYIFGDDLFNYIWKCFRPESQRPACAVRYNFELWGPQFATMVRYFKDKNRSDCGSIDELYEAFEKETALAIS